MNKPIRIQRKRTKGYDMQAQSPDGRPVVSVCRPGRHGNPWRVGSTHDGKAPATAAEAAALFRAFYKQCYWLHERVATELRGKHLACFCALSAPCHADVLLEIANA